MVGNKATPRYPYTHMWTSYRYREEVEVEVEVDLHVTETGMYERLMPWTCMYFPILAEPCSTWPNRNRCASAATQRAQAAKSSIADGRIETRSEVAYTTLLTCDSHSRSTASHPDYAQS